MTSPTLTPTSSPARTGVWIGIATITMSFTAYTSAMVVRQGSGADWQHVALPGILYLNTALLLLSSGTLELGRRRLRAGASGAMLLTVTLALGLLFLAGQVVAWRSLAAQGVYLATNPASDFFYIFTALHGLHLVGGIAALGYILGRTRGDSAPPWSALEAVSLYWHFMGVLWLYLLLILATRL